MRFRAALAGWGLTAPLPERARLDVDELPGAETLDDAALDKELVTRLRALEPFLTGGVPASARVRIQAEAGLLDAPSVTRQVLLTFPETTALGLRALGTLEELAEPLGMGRFLVDEAQVGAVEERLSELGIPFPAEHSSLRDKARMQATLAQLRAAVSGESVDNEEEA